MGFFKKIFKGIKKVVKKIGKGIKKVAAKVGKFVGKLGIVGQIGMFFIAPHLGAWLMKGLGGAANFLTGIAGQGLGSTLARGLGHVLNGAHKFVTVAKNTFGTITEGVGQFAKTTLNKIPGVNIDGAATNYFGNDSAWSRTMKKGSTILDPFKNQITATGKKTVAELARSAGVSEKQFLDLNPDLANIAEGGKVPEGVYKTFADKSAIVADVTTPTQYGGAVTKEPGSWWNEQQIAPDGTTPDVTKVDPRAYSDVNVNRLEPTQKGWFNREAIGEGVQRAGRSLLDRYSGQSVLATAERVTSDYNRFRQLIDKTPEQEQEEFFSGSGSMAHLGAEASIGYSSQVNLPSAASLMPGIFGNARVQAIQSNYALPSGV